MTKAEAIAEIRTLKMRLNYLEKVFAPQKKRKVKIKKSDDDKRIDQLFDQLMINLQKRKSK